MPHGGTCLLLQALHPDPGPGHSLAPGVGHEAPHPAVHGGQERDHGAIMRPPLPGQAPGRRPLLTTDLDCELETVCEEEGEVLETSGDNLEVVTAIIPYRDRVWMTRTVTEMISLIVVLTIYPKHHSSDSSPFVHEGMVVSVAEGEVIEGVILLTHRVLGVSAGGAVVPGEGDHGPAVVEVHREDKVVAQQVSHDSLHLRLRGLRRQFLSK